MKKLLKRLKHVLGHSYKPVGAKQAGGGSTVVLYSCSYCNDFYSDLLFGDWTLAEILQLDKGE